MAHMHYKGTGRVHSFRGLLDDEDQRKIRIQGPVGAIAWRITKFQVIQSAPGLDTTESTVKIYREFQTSIDAVINFTDQDLLGVALWHKEGSAQYPATDTIIFDNALFSRNIFVSQKNTDGDKSVNYYIELEEVKLSKVGMAQLAVAAARRREER